jgi:hypothetical protein
MSALDKYHDAVLNALIKDGWIITHDPLRLTLGKRAVLIDVGAEKTLIGAEKGTRRIAVEIKTFGGGSQIHALEQAVGQFGLYESVLSVVEPERELYLAITEEAEQTIFQEEIGLLMLAQRIRRAFSVSIEREEIVKWIP